MDLMRQVLNPRNLATAQHRVVSNGGSPGIDGMKVTQLKEYMQQHREDLIEAILSGTYQPQLVRGMEPSHEHDLNTSDCDYYRCTINL